MVFSSVLFLFLFLPLFLLVYFVVRPSYRNVTLLLASLLFYFWGEGRYVIVMIIYMVFNWGFGILIQKFKKHPSHHWINFSKAIFVFSIVFNLGFLVYYKYFNFIIENINQYVMFSKHSLNFATVHLPIGISFFTFQAISYVIDVYRSDVKAQKNIIDFSMYKALFPQLIAGPIVRYRDVASQINNRIVSYKYFALGAERFMIGLVKKVFIANNMALIADNAFVLTNNELSTEVAWLGIICYALQIYFDFSGYSDMAIGLGRMLGFTFLENFNYPYISKSIQEFWRRWHISLSSWFRDYLYISLGGNRHGKYRTYLHLFVVFFICGLWHGASWTFVVWGIWHGLFLVFERTAVGKSFLRIHPLSSFMYTILIVIIGWVFFRANTMTHAFDYFHAMFGMNGFHYNLFLTFINLKMMIALVVGIVFCAPLFLSIRKGKGIVAPKSTGKQWYRIAYYTLLFCMFGYCILELSTNTYNPFIYFRF